MSEYASAAPTSAGFTLRSMRWSNHIETIAAFTHNEIRYRLTESVARGPVCYTYSHGMTIQATRAAV